MKGSLEGDKPIYVQIKEGIEDQILQGELKEGDQIPSTNEMVQFYRVNHLTVAKGMNILADEGIIYKKRGLGMFVEKGAKEQLLKKRKEGFQEQFILPLLREATKIGMNKKDLVDLINEVEGKDATKIDMDSSNKASDSSDGDGEDRIKGGKENDERGN